MTTVLLVIHIMIAAALVGIVLLQKNEGGALGMGGGGFMSGRGQANALTRATAILGAMFFATSIALSLLSNYSNRGRSVFETPTTTSAPSVPGAPAAPAVPTAPTANAPVAPATPAPATPAAPRGGILDKLQGSAPNQ